jgi:surface antigen
MKQTYLLMMLFISAITCAQGPIITLIVDGDCSGGNPKLLEIYADGPVDFANFSLENETNAGTTFGNTFSLAAFGTVTDGFIYVTTTGSAASITSEFPSLSGATIETSGTMNINGDDRVRIVDTNSNVIDQYGVSGTDGSGAAWEYADSYAKRVDGTGPDSGFTEGNWTIPGAGTLNNQGTCQMGTAFETLIGGVGTYTTVASTTPEMTVGGDLTGLDYFENNGPSNEGTINVSGRNLTNDITVTSTVFEISETSGGTFSTSLSLQQQGGDIAATTLYVRLAAGNTAGSYVEDINFVSGGAPSETVSVAGTVSAATPDVFISGGATAMNYNEGSGPSNEDSFAVSGRFLTGTDISVTVAAPFEISLSTGGTFSSQVNVPVTNGTVDFVDVFVRLAAGQLEGTYTSTVTASSTGTTDDTIDVDGAVFATANCPNVGDLIITEIFANPANANLSDGDGEYFEVYNTTGTAIDMQSFTIADDGSDSFTVNSSVVVPALGYVVFNRNGDATTNGGVTTDYDYGTTMSLANSADEIILICNGVEIDRVDYTGAWPIEDGIAAELSLSTFNSIDNDDITNWGEATNEFFTGNFGTPGIVNDFTLSSESLNMITFNMYPNPVSGNTLFIESSNGASMTVAVYSTLGQQVINKKEVTSSVNISSLDTGIYIVQITQGTQVQTRKLIVE